MTGQAIPPFVIFDAKSLNKEWMKDQVPGTTYSCSAEGWVDTVLFEGWLTNHLLLNAVGARPLLLLLDGHSSHYQPELIRFVKEHKIFIFYLPSHTTHESQLLDVSMFKPLKQNWQELCDHYMKNNPGKVVTKYQFSGLLKQTREKTMTPATIMVAFQRCGVYPLNPDAIDCSISVSNREATLESFGGGSSENSEEDEENDKTTTQNSIICFKHCLKEAMTCQTWINWNGFVFIIQILYLKIHYLIIDKIPWQVIFIY